MPVVLLNPAANASAVSFLLGADPQTLDAGREFQVRVPTGTFLEFSPGPGLGVSQYLLEAGVYEFQLTKSGWELHRTTFRVTLDNSANATDFNYLANAQPVVLKAGEKRTHEGDFPVVIAFDRGDGQQGGPRSRNILVGRRKPDKPRFTPCARSGNELSDFRRAVLANRVRLSFTGRRLLVRLQG